MLKKREQNFSPESRSQSTRARKFRKKQSKIQQIIKPLPGIIFSQNGMRWAEKGKTKFQSRIPFTLDPGKEILIKNSKKIQKITKSHPGIIFSQNGMRQAEKVKTKFQSRIPIILDPGMKIPKKIVKNSTNCKTSSWDYFQPKRDDISQKREKKFQLGIPFILDPGKKIPKKIVKKFKKL